ncbi:outer membrane beta-barrel protein [Limnohabitans sp. INBF002]|uniref:outer membrane beta-barrel protein n=1 Tax=Limnohabitans sp. INBF002 TaxID=2986280 RepID=UPI002377BEFF|nr:outer membrane beta-barrel protein [Limnohabitans sp. INBF002]BDU52066.1 hypothetical protein LINBF2_03010 [Limnohabitans sp. INBF002]
MKTISRLLASLVLVATAGVASAQGKAPAHTDYYAEAGLLGLRLKGDQGSDTPKLGRFIVGKEINRTLSVEGMAALTLKKADGTSADVLGVFVKPKMALAKDVDGFIRVGAATTSANGNGEQGLMTRMAYGFGVETQLTKDIYGQVDYMQYAKSGSESVRGFTLSVGTRF